MYVVCCAVIDVAFVVDSSLKAQGQAAWTQMISFVSRVFDLLLISRQAVRVSFVRYGDQASVEFRLSEYFNRHSAKQRVAGISYLGNAGSNLPDALDALRNQVFQTNAGARFMAPWVAVIVTDRSPTIRAQELVTVASQVRAAGIQIIPVGVLARQLDRNILTQIAYAQTRLTTVSDYSQLAGVASQISNWICVSTVGKIAVPWSQCRPTYVRQSYFKQLKHIRLTESLNLQFRSRDSNNNESQSQ